MPSSPPPTQQHGRINVTSPTTQRLRLHDPATSAAAASRNSIIHSSAKGWSPLQITKRGDGMTSPVRPETTGDQASGTTRRTSSSFRHMATNSLVAKSPFKDLSTREGALSNGRAVEAAAIIHERRTGNRQLGQTPKTAAGSANTPRAAIGLGLGNAPVQSRLSAASRTRKVSSERKVSIEKSASRVASIERKVSATKENEPENKDKPSSSSSSSASPSSSSTPRRRVPRKSLAFKALVDGEYVTNSPFLNERRDNPADSDAEESAADEEVLASPRRVSSGSNRRKASPSANLATQARTSHSPSASPQRKVSGGPVTPSPLRPSRADGVPPVQPSPTPTKSALSASRRLLGPRSRVTESPSRKTVTFQSVPDVKEFTPHSREVSLDNFGFSNFELEPEEDEEWTDDVGDDWLARELQKEESSQQQSPSSRYEREMSHDSEDSRTIGDTSATADFMESFYDDSGSPLKQMSSAPFEDQADFEMPMEASFEVPTESSPRRDRGQDESVSADSQDVVLSTPLIEQILLPQSPHHAHTITPHLNPGAQPDLPHPQDHSMLLNANAAQPATANPLPPSPGPHAHQEGALYDPFLTIQTATDIIGDHKDRSEGGVPLGRTSHADRVHAARVLATQQLGRGFPSRPPVQSSSSSSPSGVHMPGSSSESDASPPVERAPLPQPPVSKASNDVFGAVISSPAARKVSPAPPRKVSDRKVSDVPELQGPSKRMSAFRARKEVTTPQKATKALPELPSAPATPVESTPRRMNRPLPPPAPIDLPSPVQLLVSDSDESEVETEAETARSESASPAKIRTVINPNPDYSLPDIGVSPLIADAPVFNSTSPDKEGSVSPIKRRVSASAPRLSLSAELEQQAADAPPAPRPRVSDMAPKLELSPDLEEQVLTSEGSEEDDAEELVSEADTPLTPPPVKREEGRKESPRIPSFEFGGISLDMPKDESDDGHDVPETPTKPASRAATPLATPAPVMITTAPSPAPSVPSTPMRKTPNETSTATPSRVTPNRSPIPSPVNTTTPSRVSRPPLSSPLASAPVMNSHSFTAGLATSTTSSGSSGGEFGLSVEATKDISEASTTTRVRQRISREMIREQVSKRVAAETATGNGRPKSMVVDSPSRVISPIKTPLNVSQTATPNVQSPSSITFDMPSPPFRRQHRSSASSMDKNLPAPPADAVQLDRVLSPVSPTSPRSPPMSPTAQAALHQLSGGRDSPKSALDRIMTAFGKDDSASSSPTKRVLESPNKLVPPVSILRKSEGDDSIPASQEGSINDSRAARAIRKSRRRSASTGDASRSPRLTLGGEFDDTESILESVREDIDRIGSARGYRIRERGHVRATYTDGLRSSVAGDLETHRSWKPVRRPSDMSQHSRELRAARAREASEGKASGTVYVKVLGIESLALPLPSEQTHFCITLDNGIDYIRTPYTVLKEGARVNQEFSLVEHANFEFSLSLDVRRDPHITRLITERTRPVTVATPPTPVVEPIRAQSPAVSSSSRSGGGFRALFGTPRKAKHQRTQSTPIVITPAPAPVAPKPQRPRVDTIAKYFVDSSNTVAKTHIALKPIASQCEAKVLEIRYPMFAMFKSPALPDGTAPRPQVAKITIQVLRLPPLPGLSPDELPGSIEETLRGLKHHKWHEEEYHEGILTQVGGDCRVPRRRMFKLRGASLLAINEVTKREVATIDMRELDRVVDQNAANPNSDDYDPYTARPRSFQLRFKDGESLVFSADRDEDKAVWMETFQSLLSGRIPVNPLWAEMYAEQRKREKEEAAAKRSESGAVKPSDLGPRRASRNVSGMSKR